MPTPLALPTLPVAIQYLLYAVTLVLFVGAVVVYLRGSSDKGTIKTLQDSNEALIQQQTVMKNDIELLRTENQHLKDSVRVLENTVNSGDKIDAFRVDAQREASLIKQEVQHHHEQAMAKMDAVTAGNDQLHADNEQIHAYLAGLPVALADALRGKL